MLVLKLPFISDPGKKLGMFISEVFWDTELFKSVEFYLKDGLEMAIFGDTGEESEHMLLRSPERSSSSYQ